MTEDSTWLCPSSRCRPSPFRVVRPAVPPRARPARPSPFRSVLPTKRGGQTARTPRGGGSPPPPTPVGRRADPPHPAPPHPSPPPPPPRQIPPQRLPPLAQIPLLPLPQ